MSETASSLRPWDFNVNARLFMRCKPHDHNGSSHELDPTFKRPRSNTPPLSNMAGAIVFVDHFPETPARSKNKRGHVFGGTIRMDNQQRVIKELTGEEMRQRE